MWRFFLYHRKHLESEGCHFNWPICDDMFVMVWVWTRVAIYHMFLRRWSIGWSLPCGECFDFKCVFWVYVNAFFFPSVWFSEWKTSYQEHVPAIKAFIGFLWPGHKDSCGRQQWLWYRTKHTMNLSIFGQTVASEHSCRKLYQPCTLHKPHLLTWL